MSGRIGSRHLRKRSGPSTQGGGRHAYMEYAGTVLAQMLASVDPTDEEMALIEAALPRWGKKDPTVCDVLGDVRPGIESILSLMAQDVEPAP